MTQPDPPAQPDPMSDIQARLDVISKERADLESELGSRIEDLQAARAAVVEVEQRLKAKRESYRAEAKAMMAQLREVARVRAPYKKRSASAPTGESEAPPTSEAVPEEPDDEADNSDTPEVG